MFLHAANLWFVRCLDISAYMYHLWQAVLWAARKHTGLDGLSVTTAAYCDLDKQMVQASLFPLFIWPGDIRNLKFQKQKNQESLSLLGDGLEMGSQMAHGALETRTDSSRTCRIQPRRQEGPGWAIRSQNGLFSDI